MVQAAFVEEFPADNCKCWWGEQYVENSFVVGAPTFRDRGFNKDSKHAALRNNVSHADCGFVDQR